MARSGAGPSVARIGVALLRGTAVLEPVVPSQNRTDPNRDLAVFACSDPRPATAATFPRH